MPAKSASALSAAARKAWETRRARATMMAGAAALASAPVVVPAAVPAPQPSALVSIETDATIPRRPAYQRPQLEPVAEFQMVSMWLDDAVVGCGVRRFIVLEMSAAEVRLFYAPRLLSIVIPRKLFDMRHEPARKVNRAMLARIIRENIKLADRLNDAARKEVFSDGGRYAERALDLLTL